MREILSPRCELVRELAAAIVRDWPAVPGTVTETLADNRRMLVRILFLFFQVDEDDA